MVSRRDIDREHAVWVRMWGQAAADRLRVDVEAYELLRQLDDDDADSGRVTDDG